jgi:formylmethanofuran dehydrogenase subunit B
MEEKRVPLKSKSFTLREEIYKIADEYMDNYIYADYNLVDAILSAIRKRLPSKKDEMIKCYSTEVLAEIVGYNQAIDEMRKELE